MKLSANYVLLLCVVFAYVARAQDDDPCHGDDVTDCASCLNVPGHLCAWCETNGVCNQRSNFTNDWCANFTDPESRVEIAKNEKLGGTKEPIYQVGPQKYKVYLRRGDPVNLTVTVHRTKNYPIDLYYLMDFSNSTSDDLKNLKRLASQLFQEMKDLTSDLQVGFGAFIDKPTWPYVNPLLQGNPCSGSTTRCPPAFSFTNIRPLTKDEKEFYDALNPTETSSNIDAPEGLTDALMQVVVCKEEINWRSNTLKLLVIATDDEFHAAGDGRLGGVYKPNDGQCHMNTEKAGGTYMMALDQDYPSISQIRSILQDNGISPIFAVTGTYLNLYRALQAQLLPVISSLGELGDDANNVIDLIKQGYEDVASQVSLDIRHANIDHRVFVETCPNVADIGVGQRACTGVQVEQNVTFVVEISLKECQSDSFTFQIRANPWGDSEVTVVPLCECDCASHAVEKAPKCNSNGDLECGICKCDSPWRPPFCATRCIEDEEKSGCRANKAMLPCSGNGECDCNQCKCNKDAKGNALWFGKYCQCRTKPCDYAINQQQCGGNVERRSSIDLYASFLPGAGRGSCQCNETDCGCECVCQPGWKNVNEDQACDCSTDETDCKASPGATVLCGGHGVCACGSCECPPAWDDGIRCEECDACLDLCERDDQNVSSCVQCRVLGGGSGGYRNYTNEECYSNATCPYKIVILEQPPESLDDYEIKIGNVTYETTRRCLYLNEENCELTYYAALTDDNELVEIHALAKDTEECSSAVGSVPIVPIVIGIIVGIVGIGLLLLLLWWLLAKLRDYREYKAFQQEQANAAWNQTTSPLYEPPNKKYPNPMYKKKAV